jgi:membrane protease YdiL (CAAX protease family)
MGVILFFYWHLLSATPARRAGLRANPITPLQWSWALIAFGFGFTAINATKVVLNTWLDLPVSAPPEIGKVPLASVVAYVFMLSLVAAVTEEAGFRGFMQGPLERSHGPFVAILIGGVIFWIGHILQFAGAYRLFLLSIWYFLAASALMGAIAWLTNSILPSLAAHAIGDFLFTLLTLWAFAHGFNLEKTSPGSTPFHLAILIAVIAVALALWAFRRLAGSRRQTASADHSGSPIGVEGKL